MDRTNRIFKLISVILMATMFLFFSCSSESDDSTNESGSTTQRDFFSNSKWGQSGASFIEFDGKGNMTFLTLGNGEYSASKTSSGYKATAAITNTTKSTSSTAGYTTTITQTTTYNVTFIVESSDTSTGTLSYDTTTTITTDTNISEPTSVTSTTSGPTYTLTKIN